MEDYDPNKINSWLLKSEDLNKNPKSYSNK